MVLIVITIVVVTIAVIVSMSVVMVMVAVVLMSVARRIFVVVPLVAHEVDRPTAGVILRAMLAPMLFMAGRDVQIDRWCRHELRRLRHDDRLRIDDRGSRDASQFDLSIKARLTQGDGYTDVGGKRRGGARCAH